LAKTLGRSKEDTKKPIFYGWWIVIAGSISQGYTSGAFWQGFGAFFDPIVEQFGWSRATTSAAISLQRTESGAISPFVGYFVDKFGPRNVMIFGIVLTGLGFIMLSRINSLWQFYAAFVVITIGLSFGTFLIVTTAVANWFVTKRSKALSITMAGSGLGGMLVPVVVWLIATTDWRTGLVYIGIGFLIVGIPVAFVMRSRPEDYGLLPDGADPVESDAAGSSGDDGGKSGQAKVTTRPEARFTARQALKTRTFWQLVAAMGASQLIISASIHHIPAVTSFGMSREVGGLVILGVSLFSVVGRLGSGYIGDQMDKRKVIAFAFACQFLGTLVFAFSTTIWHLVIFVILWGLGFGASIPVRFALIADMFGRRHYGSVMGTMMTASTVFGVIGPVFVGWVFDLRGNYRDPFIIIAASVLISIPLILTLSRPKELQNTGD
jgi:MFS family permease